MNRLLLSNLQNSENEEKAGSKPYVKKKLYASMPDSTCTFKSFSESKEGKRKGKKYSCETVDKIVPKLSYIVSYTV